MRGAHAVDAVVTPPLACRLVIAGMTAGRRAIAEERLEMMAARLLDFDRRSDHHGKVKKKGGFWR